MTQEFRMQVDHLRGTLRRNFRFGSLALFAGFVFLAGCGGPPLDTDNTTGGAGEELGLEETQIPDQPFGEPADGSDPFGDSGTGAQDVADTTPLPQLEDVFFNYDRFELDADSRAVLASNARMLRDRTEVRVVIEGHCDERGTSQYNMALGWKRANETKRYLVSLGIAASRIETASYGKEKPFSRGIGEAVWSQNRRAHFAVGSGSGR